MFQGTPAAPDNNYRQVIGATGYLAIMSRPDIAWTQGHFARFSSCVTREHMGTLEHFKRYIAGTKETYLSYSKVKGPFRISAEADSDWRSRKGNELIHSLTALICD